MSLANQWWNTRTNISRRAFLFPAALAVALLLGIGAVGAKPAAAQAPMYGYPTMPAYSMPGMYGYPTMPAYSMPGMSGYGYPMMQGYAMPVMSSYSYSPLSNYSYSTSAGMPYGMSYSSLGATDGYDVGVSWQYCTILGGGPIWIPQGSSTLGLLC